MHTLLLTFLFRYQDDLSLEDAIHTAILVLKEGFEGNMTSESLEIGILSLVPPTVLLQERVIEGAGAAGKAPALTDNIPHFHILSESEIADYLSNL